MKKYKGNNVTATRYHFVLVGNDYEQRYEVIDTRNNNILFYNDDEDVCLEFIIKLTVYDNWNEKIILKYNHL